MHAGTHKHRYHTTKMQAARARRGAPWTFNAEQFVACVRELTTQGYASCPSFDHGVGDPKPGGVQILPSHR